MRRDNRKALRRPIRYAAWLITAPGESQSCLLSDISDTGARIEIDNPKKVPDRFLLWLSANGSARRTCRVVWRKPRQIGVSFELHLADADRASLVPKFTADGDAEAIASDTARAEEASD